VTTVLVVEDNDDVRLLLLSVLSLAGFEVTPVAAGEQALSLLEGSGPLPDVTLLDVELPGLDGWEVLGRIRGGKATSDLPVVMCTVAGEETDIARSRELRCDGYLLKPFAIEDLVDELTAAVARQSPAPKLRS
jgi:CheY-like chemotaxis protein